MHLGTQAKIQKLNVDALIDSVVKGKDAQMVVETLVEPKREATGMISSQVTLCLSVTCNFKTDSSEVVATKCPLCGTPTGTFYQESPKNVDGPSYLVPSNPSEPLDGFLGCLRPTDQFTFSDKLPFKETKLKETYTIVPTPRGFISFADSKNRVFKLRLDLAFAYPVVFQAGTSLSSDRRFYPGDKVKHKVTGAIGEIMETRKDLAQVKFEDQDDITSLKLSLLALHDKEETTRGYIKKDGKGWVVKYAYYNSRHHSLIDALKTLHREHRTGFYRYSKWLASGPESVELTQKEKDYLKRTDPKIWKNHKS